MSTCACIACWMPTPVWTVWSGLIAGPSFKSVRVPETRFAVDHAAVSYS
jgi:hypothetical protein